jgi:hypothetical protein
MTLPLVPIGTVSVSKLVLGGNPFSGFSHQTVNRDGEMRSYYTAGRIKETLRDAEALGINTFVGRTDRHIRRVLLEYWDDGGAIQWFAQTCPEYGPPDRSVAGAAAAGAVACYVHGGQMDHFLAQGRTQEVVKAIAAVREAGMIPGVAGHDPRVFEWAEEHLEVDFYLCSYYNPSRRDERAQHDPEAPERFAAADRVTMTKAIQGLSRPVIHYKVMAAGRNHPPEAFRFVARHLRPEDAVCVGAFTRDNPHMLKEDLQLLEDSLRESGT